MVIILTVIMIMIKIVINMIIMIMIFMIIMIVNHVIEINQWSFRCRSKTGPAAQLNGTQLCIHPHRLFTKIFILIVCSQVYSSSSFAHKYIHCHHLFTNIFTVIITNSSSSFVHNHIQCHHHHHHQCHNISSNIFIFRKLLNHHISARIPVFKKKSERESILPFAGNPSHCA